MAETFPAGEDIFAPLTTMDEGDGDNVDEVAAKTSTGRTAEAAISVLATKVASSTSALEAAMAAAAAAIADGPLETTVSRLANVGAFPISRLVPQPRPSLNAAPPVPASPFSLIFVLLADAAAASCEAFSFAASNAAAASVSCDGACA